MGNSLMDILVKLGLDSSAFDKGVKDAEAKAGSLQSGLSKIGGASLIAAGAGAAALTGFLASSIGPASDLSETVSKVGVVFGDAAESVLAFGDNAASALGMSRNEALSAAGTYGNLFRAMGMTENTSADMSTSLVTLAGDLASFNNMNPTEVLDKLRAGLSGETEPLKSLGVNLTAATIEAKALEMGLWSGTGAIDAASKAQASYALIMEQTTLAQGDFARTSDGLANQQRVLSASFKDIKAKVGGALLPLINKLAKAFIDLFANPTFQAGLQAFIKGVAAFADKVAAAFPGVLSFFKGVFGWLAENKGVIVGALAAIAVAVGVFLYTTATGAIAAAGGMAVLWASLWPVLLVMAAVAAVAYLVYTAWTENWGGIQEKLAAVWAVIQPVFEAIKQWLAVNIPKAINAVVGFWSGTLLPALQTAWAWIQANLIPLFTKIGQLIGAVLTVAVRALAGIWQNVLLPAITKVWEFIGPKLMPLLENLGKTVMNIAGFIGDKLAAAFDAVSNAIGAIIGWIDKMITKLKNIKLPDWMTPGSPTPWEIGLVGISDAMRHLSTAELPRLESSLELRTPPGAMGGNADTSTRGGGNTYNIFAKEQPGQIMNGLKISELMGGAA